MKALRLEEMGAPLVLADVDDPVPGEGQVVVEVAGCGVCHTDIGFWKDGVPTRKGVPLTLGHEVSGTVVDASRVGPELLGREVIVPSVIPCGECDLCRRGRGNACRSQLMPGNDIDGGFAERIAVPARGLCLVEERGGYALHDLSVVADAVTTPFEAIVRSGLEAGELAIVVGVGGVGTHCVQIAAAFGAEVVAIDVDISRLEAVSEYGAGLTLDAATDFKDLKKQVRSWAGDRGCAPHGWKIFECSGHPAGQQTAFGLLTYAAVLLVIGFTPARGEFRLSNLMAFDATAQGTWGCKPELYPEALALVTAGKVRLDPFIETFPMSEGPSVLERVANHEVDRRAILVPDWT